MKCDNIYCEFEEGNFESFINLDQFKNNDTVDTSKYCEWMKLIVEDFENRFQDFQKVSFLLKFAKTPSKITINELKQVCAALNLNFSQCKEQYNSFISKLLLGGDEFAQISNIY